MGITGQTAVWICKSRLELSLPTACLCSGLWGRDPSLETLSRKSAGWRLAAAMIFFDGEDDVGILLDLQKLRRRSASGEKQRLG